MNLLDILLLIFIGLNVFEGLRKGLARQLLELGGVVLAFIMAVRYGTWAGGVLAGVISLEGYVAGLNYPFLDFSQALNALYNGLGYVAVFVAVLFAARFVAIAIGAVTKLPVVGTVDRLGGLVVGLVKGGLIALVIVWVLDILPIASLNDAVSSSQLAASLLRLAPGLYQRLRDLLVSTMV